MTKIFSLFIIYYSLLVNNCFSQVTQQWVARYNSPDNNIDAARSITIDASGNVYVTGFSNRSSTFSDYCTIKYNPSGIQQWISWYNGSANYSDIAYSIIVDTYGYVYVTGESRGTGTAEDYCTIKYTSNGDSMWVKRYNGPGNGMDISKKILFDNTGNVYVTGYSYGGITGFDYCTIKYNSYGDSLWVRRYNGQGNGYDNVFSMAIDNTGNVYVTGYVNNFGPYDYCTIKYTPAGVQQWVAMYNGPVNGLDGAYSITVDELQNVYVTGRSYGNGTNLDYCTIKYNSSGVQQWVSRYNGPANQDDIAYSITLDDSNNVIVTGQSMGNGTNYDFCTVKYKPNGDSLWTKRYNSPENGYDYTQEVVTDASGNIYVTGIVNALSNYSDYVTIKYSTSGNQLWLQRYNGPGNAMDEPYSIINDTSGNVYVTGGSTGSGTSMDYCTIKYNQPIGIKQISSTSPDKFILYQNYPNPFNPATKIKFTFPINSNKGLQPLVQLRIYDILGREVATLVNQQLKPGTYEVEWDGGNFASGVYYYKLVAGDYTETRKMILVK